MDEDKILWFTSPTCTPCKRLIPRAENLAWALGVPLVKIDITENPEMALKYAVTSVPTLVALSDPYSLTITAQSMRPWSKMVGTLTNFFES